MQSDAIATVVRELDPSVIIMDVEGAEIDLLAIEDLGNVGHIIVELHPHIVGQPKIDTLIATLAARGFRVQETIHKTAHFARTA